MRLEVLGKSNAYPDAGGACAGYLVTERDYRLLLDCGHGVVAKLRQRIDPTALDAVLISHLHPDHFFDLVPFSLLSQHGLEGPRPKVTVFGPPGFREMVASLRDLGAGEVLEAAFEVNEYDPGKPLQLGPLRVTFQAVPHFIETYACRVESGAGVASSSGTESGSAVERAPATFTYGADCRYNDELIAFAGGSDLLIVEATAGPDATVPADGGHMNALQAGRTGRAAGVRELLVTHFSDQHDREAIECSAREGFGGPVKLAYEGLQLDVPAFTNLADNV